MARNVIARAPAEAISIVGQASSLSIRMTGKMPVPVRLRACLHREVRVLSRITLQPVTDCNCVAVRRGGEQQEVNDQSVG